MSDDRNGPLPTEQQLADLLSVEGAVLVEEALNLYRLAAQIRDGCIVEVGSYRGRSTAALAMGSLAGFRVPVYAIEPHEDFTGIYGGIFGAEDRGRFFENMARLRVYPIVRLVNLSSEWLGQAWPHPVRLLWIDGDHRLEGVRRDLACWLPKLSADATIVFDDALDPTVGPYHAIADLLADPVWQKQGEIGKTVTLVRGAGCGAPMSAPGAS